MDVTISSRNTQVSEQLESVTREKIGRLDRLLEGLERANVHFSEEKNPRISDKEVCEVNLEGRGITFGARCGRATDSSRSIVRWPSSRSSFAK